MTYTPQYDLNHHAQIDPDHRYACHNSERPESEVYTMQNGWTSDGRRVMVEHETQWLTLDGCGSHSYSGTDPSCQGCKWR